MIWENNNPPKSDGLVFEMPDVGKQPSLENLKPKTWIFHHMHNISDDTALEHLPKCIARCNIVMACFY